MSGTGGGAPSATYDAFMRMETGRDSRTIADKIKDPNRVTWEDFKKENKDKLELGGGETRKMLEYRRQLDKERDEHLKARKRKKKRSSNRPLNSSSEDEAEGGGFSDSSESDSSAAIKKKRKRKKEKKRMKKERKREKKEERRREQQKEAAIASSPSKAAAAIALSPSKGQGS